MSEPRHPLCEGYYDSSVLIGNQALQSLWIKHSDNEVRPEATQRGYRGADRNRSAR
jgi:hypothetical protein